MTKIAYIRVSTEEQNLARQEDMAAKADKVFQDKASAKNTDRPGLNEMINYVREGDEITVYSIDRLARSVQDLNNLIQTFRDKGVIITFMKEDITFKPTTNDIYQKFQFDIFGAIAEFERAINRERQAEGIAKAKLEGKFKGRPPVLTEAEELEVIRFYTETRLSISRIAKRFRCSRSTVYNVLGKHGIKLMDNYEAKPKTDNKA